MMNWTKRKVSRHIVFWIGTFLFYTFAATSSEAFTDQIVTTIFRLPLLMIAAYVFNYWQIPKFFKTKKYTIFLISMIGVILILIFLYRVMGYFYLDRFCSSGPYPLISLVDIPFYTFSFHFPALMMYFYKVNKEQEAEKEKILELQKEKISSELKYLKAQLNPHFLFNTLNNLYSYVVMNSPKAPDMVLQLSEVLDYTLYKSQKDTVPLSEEIQAIENYLSLEHIKYGDRLDVIFDKNIAIEGKSITPLILLSIVENAFKHGVSGNITKPKIAIKLIQEDSQLNFSVWNNKPKDQLGENQNQSENGIGLENIKRQLNLIYPYGHIFEIDESEEYFHLNLTLKDI